MTHDLEAATLLRAWLRRMDTLTTEDFARGGDRPEREATRAFLARVDARGVGRPPELLDTLEREREQALRSMDA